MALQDYYNTGDTGSRYIDDTHWVAQTFTASSAYDISSVKLKLYKDDNPGTVTVSIRATQSSEPTGGDLCSGTTDGNTLTTNTDGEWREITFGSAYSLSNGVQYAIVVRGTNAGTTTLDWRYDSSSPTYGGGSFCWSDNSGSNWDRNNGVDMMFETHTASWPTGTITGSSGQSGALTFSTTGLIATAAGTAGQSGTLTFSTTGLIATVAGTAGQSADLTMETLAVSGSVAATATLSVAMLFSKIIKPSTRVITKRLVSAGNNQIWIEDI